MMGLPPPVTKDPLRAASMEAAISEHEAIFSQPNEPSNYDKLCHIRNVFDNQAATVTMRFPYEDIFKSNDVTLYQAASFIADLRCQYIAALIRDSLIDEYSGWLYYLRNRTWYLRMREQMRLCMAIMDGYGSDAFEACKN